MLFYIIIKPKSLLGGKAHHKQKPKKQKLLARLSSIDQMETCCAYSLPRPATSCLEIETQMACAIRNVACRTAMTTVDCDNCEDTEPHAILAKQIKDGAAESTGWYVRGSDEGCGILRGMAEPARPLKGCFKFC